MRYQVRLELPTRYGVLYTLIGEYRFKLCAMWIAHNTITKYNTGKVTVERRPTSHR